MFVRKPDRAITTALLFAAALALLAPRAAHTQKTPPASSAKTTQPSEPYVPEDNIETPLGANGKPITFDVVSFRRTQTPGSARVDLPETSDYIAYHGQPLARLIYFAYLAMGPKLIGGPDWINTDLYDFQAKIAPEDVPAWQKMNLQAKRRMVRTLLDDVLKLKVHANDTPENVYELVLAKDGPKNLKPWVEGETKTFPNGFVLTGVHQHTTSITATYFQGATMANLADTLTTNHSTDREVVDRTGLKFQQYDFTLPIYPLTTEQAAEVNAPSLSSALQQYGLKLQPGKATYPAVMVDHVERPPEN